MSPIDRSSSSSTEPPRRSGTRSAVALAGIAVALVAVVFVLRSRGAVEASPVSSPGTVVIPVATSAPSAISTTAPGTTIGPTSSVPGGTVAPAGAEQPAVLSSPFVAIQPAADGAFPIYDHEGDSEPKLTLPNPRVVGTGTTARVPLVLLVERDLGDWYQVLLPVRPNGSTGFVRRSDTKIIAFHSYHLEVSLGAFTLKVFKGADEILDLPIAVAADNTPTPGGLYYTTELVKPPDPNTVYGTYAYGLSGFSDALQTFNGGPGQIAIHGTNDPAHIGQKVSHGCIRLRNEDIEKLVPILPLGVPVQIVP